jgi:hypothetical protein
MTWEQKYEAMSALVGHFNISLKMRKAGDWYVMAKGREIGGNGMLLSAYGNGKTPEKAIEDDWEKYTTELGAGRIIVINAAGKDRCEVRWNGYRWEGVPR